VNHVNRLCTIVFATVAIVAAVVLPAHADDDVATKAPLCGACHGQAGTPINAVTPVIWGQESNYLYKELHDFHSGDRNNATMSPLVKDITLPDLRALADYFAAKNWPAQPATNPAAAAPDAIASKIEMCKACHQKNFEGGLPAPRLAGMSADYLLSAMNNFADGARTNNLDMPGFMKALSAGDREAIAKYLSGL
jgi:cytochrome c553